MDDRSSVKLLLTIVDEAEAAWRADLALLGETHRTLRVAVSALSARDLTKRRTRSPFNNAALISGIAAHDIYHAGQIQLIKKLRK